MQVLKPRFHHAMAACLLIVAIAGNLVILQCVAWMGMLVSYSQQDGLTVGIQKTFDGKHPCKICKLVNKSERNEQNSKLVKSAVKIDWILVKKTAFAWTPSCAESAPATDEA